MGIKHSPVNFGRFLPWIHSDHWNSVVDRYLLGITVNENLANDFV